MSKWMHVRLPLPPKPGAGFDPRRFGRTVLQHAVLEHYQEGRLTLSAAARMLGLSRSQFLRLLGERRVPAFGARRDDRAADLADADDLLRRLSATRR